MAGCTPHVMQSNAPKAVVRLSILHSFIYFDLWQATIILRSKFKVYYSSIKVLGFNLFFPAEAGIS